LQNKRWAIIHGEFITEAIHDILIRGLTEECENQPYVEFGLILVLTWLVWE
jgi:hypothetical protein